MYRLFKGTNGQYRSLHDWVRRQLGPPETCENCGTSEGLMHWANMSGDYLREVSDWASLCARCHFLIDGLYVRRRALRGSDHPHWRGDKCRNGHALTGDNLYKKPKPYGFDRICRTCKNDYRRLRRATIAADTAKG